MKKVLSFGLVALSLSSLSSLSDKTGLPLEEGIPLPDSVLAFPDYDQSYRKKILPQSGYYEIKSEARIIREARSMGVILSGDNPAGNWNFHRAVRVYAPGLVFQLRAPVEKHGRYRWKMVLDIAFPKEVKEDYLGKNLSICVANLPCRFLPAGTIVTQPIEVEIPYIRDGEGEVRVELQLANGFNSYLQLYDAFLTQD